MQIVIDIDEESYEQIKLYANEEVLPIGWHSIINGTPLEEELHREKEQAYYLGYEDGRKSERTAVAESEDKE